MKFERSLLLNQLQCISSIIDHEDFEMSAEEFQILLKSINNLNTTAQNIVIKQHKEYINESRELKFLTRKELDD